MSFFVVVHILRRCQAIGWQNAADALVFGRNNLMLLDYVDFGSPNSNVHVE
jgi:hypothetical protein